MTVLNFHQVPTYACEQGEFAKEKATWGAAQELSGGPLQPLEELPRSSSQELYPVQEIGEDQNCLGRPPSLPECPSVQHICSVCAVRQAVCLVLGIP